MLRSISFTVGPRWAPCWPQEPCYEGCKSKWLREWRHIRPWMWWRAIYSEQNKGQQKSSIFGSCVYQIHNIYCVDWKQRGMTTNYKSSEYTSLYNTIFKMHMGATIHSCYDIRPVIAKMLLVVILMNFKYRYVNAHITVLLYNNLYAVQEPDKNIPIAKWI